MPPMFLQNHRHLFLSLAVLCTRPVLLPLRSYEGELRTRSKKSNLRRTPSPTRPSRRYDATIVLNIPRPVALIRARLGARSHRVLRLRGHRCAWSSGHTDSLFCSQAWPRCPDDGVTGTLRIQGLLSSFPIWRRRLRHKI